MEETSLIPGTGWGAGHKREGVKRQSMAQSIVLSKIQFTELNPQIGDQRKSNNELCVKPIK